jgi:hypothetical protein
MKKTMICATLSAFALIAVAGQPAFAAGYDSKNKKVAICHKPGTPAQKTLYLPVSALKGHLGHGDYKGACKKKRY